MTKERIIEILEGAEKRIDTVNKGTLGGICCSLLDSMNIGERLSYEVKNVYAFSRLLSDFGFPVPKGKPMLFL